MPFCLFPAYPPERYPVIKGHIVPDLGGFPDDHAHAMIYEEFFSNTGARMYFYAGKEAADVGKEPPEEKEFPDPEPVGHPVEPEGVEPRVAEENLQ